MSAEEPCTDRVDTTQLALLGEVLHHGVREPLVALRASIEALARKAQSGRVPTGVLQGALGQVVDVSRVVQDLTEFLAPRPLQPIRCTVEEVIAGAVTELCSDSRQRLFLAVEHGRARLLVDAPQLSRCLARLMEEGLRHGANEVLLHARTRGGHTTFTMLHDARTGDLFHGREAAMDALGRTLAELEVRRMGGNVAFRSAGGSRTLCEVAGLASDTPGEVAA